jgi:Spy/CpxP family protein refolding chaperone
MRRLCLSVLCIALLGLSTSIRAQQPPGPPEGQQGPPHPHDLVREHATALGIDADTVEAIQQIAEGARTQLEALQAQVKQARGALAEALQVERPDRATVTQRVTELGDAETAVLQHQLMTLLDMHELLTPEQVKALEAMVPSGPPGGPPGGGPPPHGPPPPGMPGGPRPGL